MFSHTEMLSMYHRQGYLQAMCWIAPELPICVQYNRCEYLTGYKRGIRAKIKEKRRRKRKMNHREKLADLLVQYPQFEKLSKETEKLRDYMDEIEKHYDSPILKAMLDVDNNMIRLMRYHMELSKACLHIITEEEYRNNAV
jgi:hypothetical protein